MACRCGICAGRSFRRDLSYAYYTKTFLTCKGKSRFCNKTAIWLQNVTNRLSTKTQYLVAAFFVLLLVDFRKKDFCRAMLQWRKWMTRNFPLQLFSCPLIPSDEAKRSRPWQQQEPRLYYEKKRTRIAICPKAVLADFCQGSGLVVLLFQSLDVRTNHRKNSQSTRKAFPVRNHSISLPLEGQRQRNAKEKHPPAPADSAIARPQRVYHDVADPVRRRTQAARPGSFLYYII